MFYKMLQNLQHDTSMLTLKDPYAIEFIVCDIVPCKRRSYIVRERYCTICKVHIYKKIGLVLCKNHRSIDFLCSEKCAQIYEMLPQIEIREFVLSPPDPYIQPLPIHLRIRLYFVKLFGKIWQLIV